MKPSQKVEATKQAISSVSSGLSLVVCWSGGTIAAAMSSPVALAVVAAVGVGAGFYAARKAYAVDPTLETKKKTKKEEEDAEAEEDEKSGGWPPYQ
mmetsp:Transcript_3768/g.6439  ORF Transcript_3768/g.6439 Transcript_3768/m.6439 type:complete len:96 (-) Transcript_3768:34-321(-)